MNTLTKSNYLLERMLAERANQVITVIVTLLDTSLVIVKFYSIYDLKSNF